MRNTPILLLIISLAASLAPSQLNLTQWTFKIGGNEYPASIPSTLTQDLISNQLIPSDPYYRDNFLALYKYETQNVTYRALFTVPTAYLSASMQLLTFYGLDTHCQVYLNGEFILNASNMFRRYEVWVSVLAGANNLTVQFRSAAEYDLEREREFKEQNGFTLPQNYSFTRKAAYQYGWDWGPRILTVGIWKDVTLTFLNDTTIDQLNFTHSPITKSTSLIDGLIDADVSNLNILHAYNVSLLINQYQASTVIFKQTRLISSTHRMKLFFNFTVGREHVWWTWDLGEANLIEVSLLVTNLITNTTTKAYLRTGIRTVTIQQIPTQNGTSFTFNLNGYDIYMRGGNYIPIEMSMARTNRQMYQKVVSDMIFARFNMVRVWGGGQFQNDQFYDLLDEGGILVWHDLMFACALYSDNDLGNIREEMRDNLRRLRRHPCIGLWNGNNQVWIGWEEWGWKQNLNETQRALVEGMYDRIFRQLLPEVIAQEHASVYYWETSPSVSSNSVRTIQSGDIHFWRVWGAGTPIEEYESYIGRFNSEYGMQSMPEISSLYRFTAPSDLILNSEVLNLHQRHPMGWKYLPMYTSSYSGTTANVTRFAYFSQIMQAYALEMAIVSLRLSKPTNMGSLYWQINDVWPVSSWATVDYYGTYKAAHYRVRDVYEQLMIHTLHSGTDYIVHIVNDYNRTFACHCTLTILTFGGVEQLRQIVQKAVRPFERVQVYRFGNISKYIKTSFIKMELITSDGVESKHNFFFTKMSERENLPSGLSFTANTTTLKIRTSRIASYVWVYRMKEGRHVPMKLSQNYFTVLPKQQLLVDISSVPINELYVTCYEDEINAEQKAEQSADQYVPNDGADQSASQ